MRVAVGDSGISPGHRDRPSDSARENAFSSSARKALRPRGGSLPSPAAKKATPVPLRTVQPQTGPEAVSVARMALPEHAVPNGIVLAPFDGRRDRLGGEPVGAIETVVRVAVASVETPLGREHGFDRLRREDPDPVDRSTVKEHPADPREAARSKSSARPAARTASHSHRAAIARGHSSRPLSRRRGIRAACRAGRP